MAQEAAWPTDRRGMGPSVRPVLPVVPARIDVPAQLDELMRCLVSLWGTTDGAPAVVVAEPGVVPDGVEAVAAMTAELGFGLTVADEGTGRLGRVNLGLEQALQVEAHAVVVDPTVELTQPGWLGGLHARTDREGRPAAVVGARLVTPRGLIDHAGYYFSLLEHRFRPRFANGPEDLPAALVPSRCPVGSALTLVRHDVLTELGLYNPAFKGEEAGVDLSLRVFDAGLDCIYEPAVVARRHATKGPGPSGRAIADDVRRLGVQHADRNLLEWVPEIL
jgi:hypothetical protein